PALTACALVNAPRELEERHSIATSIETAWRLGGVQKTHDRIDEYHDAGRLSDEQASALRSASDQGLDALKQTLNQEDIR
ncbi:MAG: hypothetical protein PUK77_11835, partial [bacterium]|nr:hypothetical protein [bacterium]